MKYEIRSRMERTLIERPVAVTIIDRGGLLNISPTVEVSCRYQPIKIIL